MNSIKELLKKEFNNNVTYNEKENTIYYTEVTLLNSLLDFISYNKLKVNVQLSLL